MKADYKVGFAYWFAHFSIEVLCFYTVYRIFNPSGMFWMIAILYDTFAFVPQVLIGSFCETHPGFHPSRVGFSASVIGAAIMLLTSIALNPEAKILFLVLELTGLLILGIGNGFIHIAGALTTLRASNGRLTESAVFVGGGSFGVICGRLLSKVTGVAWIPFIISALGFLCAETADAKICGNEERKRVYNFEVNTCLHNLAAERQPGLIVMILGLVVAVRAYIGYGLPTEWNTTVVQTVFLFVFMGTGKMLGGILADRFGARRVGIISCLLSVPLLLVSNNIMWLSLIAVALFSMTMAVTLGGLVSVLPANPGVAFGVTTTGLLIGTLPTLLWGMPGQRICNILIAVLSILAALGLWYCLKPAVHDVNQD